MPTRVIIVLGDHDGREAAALLSKSGCDALSFSDPMDALDAMESSTLMDVLITSVDFGVGKPNGIALCRMARLRRRGLRTIFVGAPGLERYTAELGDYLQSSVTVSQIVNYALRRLANIGSRKHQQNDPKK